MSVPNELKRQIGLRTVTALVVGEVIAVGIFLTPAGMAKSIGSPLWLLVVWLAMGAMALCGALCYGELAARYPEAGGGHVYMREAHGHPVAFVEFEKNSLGSIARFACFVINGFTAFCWDCSAAWSFPPLRQSWEE